LDLWKAFALVHHDILLSKVERMGIWGVTPRWLQAHLENRMQKVEITYRCNKLRSTTVGDPPRWPRDTPLSKNDGSKFRRQVAVAQLV
jgi:hypothetical protein